MLIYAAIARASDASVLVDCCDPLLKGNASVVTSLLFCHLRDHPELLQEGEHQTLVQRNDGHGSDGNSGGSQVDLFSVFLDSMCTMAMGDDDVQEHFFHLFYRKGVIYCCIGDDSDLKDQKVNFAFLNRMYVEFSRLYTQRRIEGANAFGMEKTFRPNMRSAMHYYNVNHDKISQEPKVAKLTTQVQALTQIMGRNLNLLLERGEDLEVMAAQTNELQEEAQVFYRKSKVMKRQLRLKYYKTILLRWGIVGLILFTVLGTIFLRTCGIDLSKCKK
ncbi:hypothetical protein ACA910_000551 [Epithemia clementina (nom. ined.)]